MLIDACEDIDRPPGCQALLGGEPVGELAAQASLSSD